MKDVSVFMFIDALGWENVKKHKFLEDILPYQNSVKMQFGYSCTAIPTILTGENPQIHKHLSFYYYNPKESPFSFFRYLPMQLLPKFLDRWRVRHLLSKMVAKLNHFTGYFEMYSMPFDRLHYFDYIEKKDLFVPNGLAPVPNLADILEESGLKYHISNWRLSEPANIDCLKQELTQGEIDFAFLYTAALDGLQHMVTKDGTEIEEKLKWYRNHIEELIKTAEEKYDNVNFHVISDHGMTTLTETLDLKKIIENLPLKFGVDYVAVYDSTIARFWFFNSISERMISRKLREIINGKILSEDEKRRFGVHFEDNMYGELFFLTDPGVQIAPSDMGLKALPGMHGFSPDHPDSNASFLSSKNYNIKPDWVGDFFRVMKSEIDRLAELSISAE